MFARLSGFMVAIDSAKSSTQSPTPAITMPYTNTAGTPTAADFATSGRACATAWSGPIWFAQPRRRCSHAFSEGVASIMNRISPMMFATGRSTKNTASLAGRPMSLSRHAVMGSLRSWRTVARARYCGSPPPWPP